MMILLKGAASPGPRPGLGEPSTGEYFYRTHFKLTIVYRLHTAIVGMQLLNFIVGIVGLASAASAAAIPPAEVSPRDEPVMTIKFTPQSKCGHTSWKGTTSVTAAVMADCKHLESSIKEGGAVYAGNGPHQVVSYNTCKFGVNAQGNWAIGNKDISDLLRDAVARFGRDGRVGAEGDMPCESGQVQWNIYS